MKIQKVHILVVILTCICGVVYSCDITVYIPFKSSRNLSIPTIEDPRQIVQKYLDTGCSEGMISIYSSKDSSLMLRGSYFKGKPVNHWDYFDAYGKYLSRNYDTTIGKIKIESFYQNGSKESLFFYSINGNKLDSTYIHWDTTGQVIDIGNYFMGEPCGVFYLYNERGILIKSCDFCCPNLTQLAPCNCILFQKPGQFDVLYMEMPNTWYANGQVKDQLILCDSANYIYCYSHFNESGELTGEEHYTWGFLKEDGIYFFKRPD